MVTPSQLNRRAALFEQFATMIAAGVPLPKVVEMVARNRNTGIPQRFLLQLSHHLNNGHTFTDAMLLASGQKREGQEGDFKPTRSTYALSDFDTALLSAGEQSGRLDASFRLLARYYASRAKFIRDTLYGLLITIVTLHVLILVFPIGLLQGCVRAVMDNDSREFIPFIVEKVVVFGALYALTWFMIFASQANRGESWRSVMQNVLSLVPVLGTAMKYLTVARLSMALDALLNAGVPVIRSWELAANACGSIELRRQIFHWLPQIETGTTPGEMTGQIRYFPEMFTNLFQSGEISGRTDEALNHLQTYFEEEGFRKLQIFCRVLTFVIYFAVAGVVAVFVINFYMKQFSQVLNTF